MSVEDNRPLLFFCMAQKAATPPPPHPLGKEGWTPAFWGQVVSDRHISSACLPLGKVTFLSEVVCPGVVLASALVCARSSVQSTSSTGSRRSPSQSVDAVTLPCLEALQMCRTLLCSPARFLEHVCSADSYVICQVARAGDSGGRKSGGQRPTREP